MDEAAKQAKMKEDHDKYLGIDEEEIMRNMTEEELEQLTFQLSEIDPDNSMLPAGYRQPDHTKKADTGEIDHEALKQFLIDEANNVEDVEDLVPYESGVKRGKIYVKKEQNKNDSFNGGAIKLDDDIEEALKNATEGEITDLAAILGLHTLMDNEQYYKSLECGDKIINTVGFSKATQCKVPVCDISEINNVKPNSTDVYETLEKLRKNDSNITNVNLNNIKNISISTMRDYGDALATNTHLKSLSLIGTRSNDSIAKAIGEGLKSNSSLESLNLETNFLTPVGINYILKALNESDNKTLKELKVDNQKGNFGAGGEQNIAGLLNANKSLLKFSYQFKFPGPRQIAVAATTRNNDNNLRMGRMKR